MIDSEPFAFAPQARLLLDGTALQENWRVLSKQSGGAQTGAAVKADGYGLGGVQVTKLLSEAGCRDFFVAHWAEAMEIAQVVPAAQISVLNGISEADMQGALGLGATPVLNTPHQVALWRAGGGGRCHVMIDSGINRLGIEPEQIEADLFAGLDVDILLSHLASADKDIEQNSSQLRCFIEVASGIKSSRRSLANSAGIMLGKDFHFDLIRPGIALYGGIARAELAGIIKQIVYPQARILQIRHHVAGSKIGYNATYTCQQDTKVATCAIGYADGYLRGFSNTGMASFQNVIMPVIGRVSMDLVTIDATNSPDLEEGDWIDIDYSLTTAAAASGLSQYELLTGLGTRFERIWR
jgi:alanine racemase